MSTERHRQQPRPVHTGPRDWNQRKQRPPVFQWVVLTVLLALMAYLFAAL